MARKYATTATGIATGTDLPIISLEGSGSIRMGVYDIIIGSDDTPADQACQLVLERTTSAGTGGSALTEAPLDPADQAALVAAKSGTFTTPPVDANELLMISLNQRATFRWVAAPGSELLSAVTAANGLMLNSEGSTSTQALDTTILWNE